jgi:hypothetical protein
VGRRDEVEPHFGWLATVGVAIGVLLLLVVVAVAGIDAGDEAPDTQAVAAWLGRDAEVVRCVDTGATSGSTAGARAPASASTARTSSPAGRSSRTCPAAPRAGFRSSYSTAR